MKVSDLLDRLANTELNNLSIVENNLTTPKIKQTNIPRVMNCINQGIINLHTRFQLLKKELILLHKTPITHYYLRKEFALSNGMIVPEKYIDDSVLDPFEGNIVRVLSVYDEHGRELPFNDIEDPISVHMVQYDCIQIPDVHESRFFSVIYQAIPKKLSYSEDYDPYITLPEFLEEALQLYVASKVFAGISGDKNEAISQKYLSLYEAICLNIEMNDLLRNSTTTSNIKLEIRGFI